MVCLGCQPAERFPGFPLPLPGGLFLLPLAVSEVAVKLVDPVAGSEAHSAHFLFPGWPEVINKLSTFCALVSPYQGEDLGPALGILERVLYRLVDLVAAPSIPEGV